MTRMSLGGAIALVCCCALAFVDFSAPVLAQEHPAEHPSEHPTEATSAKKAALTSADLAQAITAYIASDAQLKGGYFLVYDPVVKQPLALTLERVHEDRLASLGHGVYFACADFKSTAGTIYDVDVFMNEGKEGLEVTEVHVHKMDGAPRYTWQEEGGVWARKELK